MEIKLSEFSKAEVLQYLGWRGSEIPKDVQNQIDECIKITLETIKPRWTYKVFDIDWKGETPVLKEPQIALIGNDIATMLKDCKKCIFMAATLGADIERVIRMAEIRNMSNAIILDCCGSSAIEAVCDKVEEEIKQKLNIEYLTDRFSAGYGDMPISFQNEMVNLLDTQRQIGLMLTDSCILTPRKSVTAIIGIAETKQTKRFRGCAYCSMFENCRFRKAGRTCGK